MRLILLLISFVSTYSWSQDTMQIFFETGSARISAEHENELQLIPMNYDLSSVDSIQFIGYADSTGNLNSNLRLSIKRAKNTFSKCRLFFDESKSVSILARGESPNGDKSYNRRVEIIFYYVTESTSQPDDVIENIDPKCFLIDFEALQFCNIRTVIKKKEGIHLYRSIESPDLHTTTTLLCSKRQ